MELNFSQWLMIKRKQAKISQDTLASLVGVSRQTVSNWETGAFSPSLSIKQVRALCNALNCKFEDIPDDE